MGQVAALRLHLDGQQQFAALARQDVILAGALGNLTDRLIQGFLIPYEQQHGFFTKLMNGYVVDFIDVTIPLFNYRWPAFNVADSCIFVAAIIFFIASIFSARNKEEKTS